MELQQRSWEFWNWDGPYLGPGRKGTRLWISALIAMVVTGSKLPVGSGVTLIPTGFSREVISREDPTESHHVPTFSVSGRIPPQS